MSFFKDHKVTVKELLDIIPDELLTHLSRTTKIDYYAKTLHGRKLFYLLIYGILDNEKLSQRSLEDTFNDPVFKFLFQLDNDETIRRSSISDRLSTIDFDFFKQIFDNVHAEFSKMYSKSDSEKFNLIRVDSTMVSEAANKLIDGLDNKSGKKSVKYSISFDGLLPCALDVFTKNIYNSEEIALPEAILNHVKKEANHNNIYVVDRGLQSTMTMKNFSKENVIFVCRTKENRKYKELQSFIKKNQRLDLDNSILIKDSKVQLYYGKNITAKNGNHYSKEELVDFPFRLVVIKSKTIDQKEFYFLTNNFELSAKEIADIYRRRWDIEVFFRFIKQELNVSHLVSLNKNGIMVMILMSMIAAMLILIYKKENNLGYRTAKRRFKLEIRNITMTLIIEHCGGNPKLMFKT
jgi:hypothetical protein